MPRYKLHDENGRYWPIRIDNRKRAELTRDLLEIAQGRQWTIEEQIEPDGPDAPGDHREEEFH